MQNTMIFVAAAGIGMIANTVNADDLTPPSWRGNPGTTVQHWDFNSGPNGQLPDALPLNNPFGTPIMNSMFGSWMPTFAGRNDVWDISAGHLEFEVPNSGMVTHTKELWLQVTYFGGAAPAIGPGVSIAGPTGPFTLLNTSTMSIGNGWFHELTQWSAGQCPQWERVTITPSTAGVITVIDQVVIDTYCKVPTPGSLALLGLGGLCAARRRRR